MSTRQKKVTDTVVELQLPLVNYEPAALKEWPTGWQIEYRALNPSTCRLEKIRIRFEKIRKRIGNDDASRKHAAKMCKAVTTKLEKGWSPFAETKSAKSLHKLTDALDDYIKLKERDRANNSFREDSMRTYRSQVTMLKEWLAKENIQDIQVIQFNGIIVDKYMDYVYLEKEVSPRTFNNYITVLRTIWGWLIKKGYAKDNHFKNVDVKIVGKKKRQYIPKEWDEKVIEYFGANYPNMIIVCSLVYNSFMRPMEVCRTQIKDISFRESGIYLIGDKAKNHEERWCLFTPELINMLLDLNLDRFDPEMYLFSTDLIPGYVMRDTRYLDKFWAKMRKAINMPKEYQLYSYRDTGITDMKETGLNNLQISSVSGHKNTDEIETYTHRPDARAMQIVMTRMKAIGER